MKDVSDIAARKLEKKELEFAQAQKQIQDLQVFFMIFFLYILYIRCTKTKHVK